MLLIIGCRIYFQPIKEVCNCETKLHGKVALVTGGNSGIGKETARDLARRGARVIIASRDNKKSEAAVNDIIYTTGNANVLYRHLDLAKVESIRQFAEDFKDEDRLDILVNNSGVGGLKNKCNERNIDVIMQINYFGPVLLTNLLLDKLKKSAPS
ncbi:unnamed protein product [Leptosia nina]|uniref:Uncharacterized protein n=1 Tax=Leptosia nina TaxID=320188 RepID=A0AAV1J291_9NEOP